MNKVYRFDTKPFSTHMTVLAEVPEGSKVLEIGTASGYMGEYLINEKHCEMWGVEPVVDLYNDAKKISYKKLFNSGVEAFLTQIGGVEKFDVIILADVLEHMVEPPHVLRELTKLLAPNGRVIISLPNVAHHTVRRHLLLGRWNMQSSGILDRTHLHFYTKKTAESMIADCGLVIDRTQPIVMRNKKFMQMILPKIGGPIGYFLNNFFGYQFIFVASKAR